MFVLSILLHVSLVGKLYAFSAPKLSSRPTNIPSAPCSHYNVSSRSQAITKLNLYRKFHDYGWSKLVSYSESGLNSNVPDELSTNSSPVKNTDTNVVALIQSTSQFPLLSSSGSTPSVLRLARSAFLETQTAQKEAFITPMTIHVLNFVFFPDTNIRDISSKTNEGHVALPVFGADIVSLPGNKHLVALDFQPVLTLIGDDASLLPERYSHIESKLKSIHSKYQRSDSNDEPLLLWGGDIPPQAQRFFSPYALWTRLTGDDAIDTVNTTIWNAFREYIDLYMELMVEAQKDVESGKFQLSEAKMAGDEKSENPVREGQLDYLEYRRTNDPARPMLQRLYGECWAERVIAEVLFPNL